MKTMAPMFLECAKTLIEVLKRDGAEGKKGLPLSRPVNVAFTLCASRANLVDYSQKFHVYKGIHTWDTYEDTYIGHELCLMPLFGHCHLPLH